MRRIIERVFEKYGTPVLLRSLDGDVTFNGFLQLTGSMGWKNMQPVYSPLGEVPRGQYLLMLPLEPPLEKGDVLQKDGIWYTVRRIEKMWCGEEAVYRWCLCEEGGSTGTWGSQS